MYIDRWSYWLGLVSAVIALVMRTCNAFGVWLPGTVIQGTTIWYMSFFKAALLFLIINIATAIRIYLSMLVDQRSNTSNDKHVIASAPAASKLRTATARV